MVVRADAAFALALYEALERRDVAYAIRLPTNDVLERAIEDLAESLAESHLTARLFGQILRRIERLTWHPT